MMKKILLALSVTLLMIACSKDDETETNNNGGSETTVELNTATNDFVWKAMNSWYNWQSDVANLADTKDDNQNDYHTYLNGYATSEELFKSLKHSADDFSWFIEDYVKQQQSFQGISTSFGFSFFPSLIRVGTTNKVILYIRHVSKGSPADNAGFKRGDIVNGFNGVVMTTDNSSSVLNNYYQDTATFDFVENDGITQKESKTISKAVVSDNPVDVIKTFNDINGKKVGYLLYNGFRSSYNDELNEAFAQFKSAGIQELVLDLRINRGGSVATCTYLASMIYAEANKDVFAELRFNSKHTDQNSHYYFTDSQNVYDSDGNKVGEESLNRLSGLSKLYVLTSDITASASEMIINGLRPFIDVKVIGEKTVGKNEGSITLYDSPKSDYINPEYVSDQTLREQLIKDLNDKPHKMAMQPIVFQIYNKLGQSDYSEGFEPNILVEEWKSWSNILPFGDENEELLKVALDDIRGVSGRSMTYKNNNASKVDVTVSTDKFQNEMYITGDFFNQK